MKASSDRFEISTDDGSDGHHGFVSDVLVKLIDEGEKIDYVMAIGPVAMMRAVVNVTRPRKIKTMVSLNPIMVDGTGMCGACRVSVGGQTRFACVHGPDFDGFEVDFDELCKRLEINGDGWHPGDQTVQLMDPPVFEQPVEPERHIRVFQVDTRTNHGKSQPVIDIRLRVQSEAGHIEFPQTQVEFPQVVRTQTVVGDDVEGIRGPGQERVAAQCRVSEFDAFDCVSARLGSAR